MPISAESQRKDESELPDPFPPLLAGGLNYSEEQRRRASELHERRVAQVLKEQYSQVPFYAERAARLGESYWLDLASSARNLLPGDPYKIL
jgi:hypothetical protein